MLAVPLLRNCAYTVVDNLKKTNVRVTKLATALSIALQKRARTESVPTFASGLVRCRQRLEDGSLTATRVGYATDAGT